MHCHKDHIVPLCLPLRGEASVLNMQNALRPMDDASEHKPSHTPPRGSTELVEGLHEGMATCTTASLICKDDVQAGFLPHACYCPDMFSLSMLKICLQINRGLTRIGAAANLRRPCLVFSGCACIGHWAKWPPLFDITR